MSDFYAVFSSFGLLKYFSIEWPHSALANVKQTIYSSVSEQFNLLLEKEKYDSNSSGTIYQVLCLQY